MKHHFKHRRRAGSLVIEGVLAVALLAMAAVAMAKLARDSASLERLADQRLSAKLVGENVLGRLRQVSDDDLASEAEKLANEFSGANDCTLTTDVQSFENETGRGIHIMVEVSLGSSVRVRTHDWRIDQAEQSQ